MRREAVMVVKARSRRPKEVPPLERADQWVAALMHALENPTVDKEGRVSFKARIVWPPKLPVTVGCVEPGQAVLSLPDLVTVLRCVRALIRVGRRSLR